MLKKLFLIFILFFSVLLQAQNRLIHKVIKGETLYAISKKYDVSIEEIYSWNPEMNGSVLKIDQEIIILNERKDKNEEITFGILKHKVQSGENFYSIAEKYGVTVKELQQSNKGIKPKRIKIGQELIIKVKSNKEVVLDSDIIKKEGNIEEKDNNIFEEYDFHKVHPNETKYGIAKKYNLSIQELESLNPKIKDILPIGVVLKLKKKRENENNRDVSIVSKDSLSILSEEENLLVEEFSKELVGKADKLVVKASEYIGIRYKMGGTTPKGFDCSGLMLTTFKEINLQLPRTSLAQSKFGNKIKKKEAQKGDLIFFATRKRGNINHVGLITEVNEGEIKFIHASTSSGVMISSLKEKYFSSRFKQINRVLN